MMESDPSDFVFSIVAFPQRIRLEASDGIQETISNLDRNEWLSLVKTTNKPSLSSWQSPFGPLHGMGRPPLIAIARLIRDTGSFQAFLSLVTIGDFILSRAPVDVEAYTTEFEPSFHLFISSMSSRNELIRRNDSGVLFLSPTFATKNQGALMDLMANGYLMNLIATTQKGEEHKTYIVPFRIPLKPLFRLSAESDRALAQLRQIRTQALGEIA